METDTSSLSDRVRSLEEKLEKGIIAAPSAGAQTSSYQGNLNETAVKEKLMQLPKAIPEDIQKIVSEWQTIV